jgi:hypothetical protein
MSVTTHAGLLCKLSVHRNAPTRRLEISGPSIPPMRQRVDHPAMASPRHAMLAPSAPPILPKIDSADAGASAAGMERLPRYPLARRLRVVREVSSPNTNSMQDTQDDMNTPPVERRDKFYRDLQRTRQLMVREVEDGIHHVERHVERAVGLPSGAACFDRPLLLSRPPPDEENTLSQLKYGPRAKRMKGMLQYHRQKKLSQWERDADAVPDVGLRREQDVSMRLPRINQHR